MKLIKDIFKTTEEYIEFLLFLNSKQEFTITEVEKKTGYNYHPLYVHIMQWTEQNLIIMETFPPRLGGTKLKFWLSEAAKKKLKLFLKMLSVAHQLKEKIIESLQPLKSKIAPEIIEIVELTIETFFKDFFK